MFTRKGGAFTCPACVQEQATLKVPAPRTYRNESLEWIKNRNAGLFVKSVKPYRYRFKADRLIRKK